jgi:hypothetical protein
MKFTRHVAGALSKTDAQSTGHSAVVKQFWGVKRN